VAHHPLHLRARENNAKQVADLWLAADKVYEGPLLSAILCTVQFKRPCCDMLVHMDCAHMRCFHECQLQQMHTATGALQQHTASAILFWRWRCAKQLSEEFSLVLTALTTLLRTAPCASFVQSRRLTQAV